MQTALHIAFLQGFEDQLRVLNEPPAALVLIDPKPFVFDPRQTTPNPQDEASVRDMVEHRYLFCDANRVMPGQDDHHRAELHMFGPARHIGQKLDRIGAHGVVVKMVLNRPDGIEPQRFRHLRQAEFILPDLTVGQLVVGILKHCSVAYMHGILLRHC